MARAKSASEFSGKELKYGLADEKKEELVASLMANNFNITRSCNAVNVDRNVFYYLIKYDEDFKSKISWGENFLSHLVTNGVLEGIINPDLVLRHKYLELLAKSGVLARLLNLKEDKQEITLKFDKSQIVLD